MYSLILYKVNRYIRLIRLLTVHPFDSKSNVLYQGYGVVKTLTYVKEPRDISATSITSQLTDKNSGSGASPRKRKARGMFTDDDKKSVAVVIHSDQKSMKRQVFYLTYAKYFTNIIRAKKNAIVQ